jgi:hypothetical protein
MQKINLAVSTENNMAGLDSVNQTDTTEESTVTPQVTPAAAPKGGRYSLPTVKGTVGLDSGILEQMQNIIAQKEAKQNSFGEALRDVMAYDVGYRGDLNKGLRERAAEKEGNAADIFNMKSQIAQYKAAQQKQANFEARRAKMLNMGPGAGQGQQGAQVGGMYLPDHIKLAIADAPTEEAANKIFNEFAIKYNTNSTMFTPTVPVVAIGPDGQPYRKIVSVDEYRRNQHLYEDTPETQKAVTTPGAGTTPATAPAAAPTTGAQPPVSVRNNNPGNLVDPKTGQFRVFDTPEEGEAALDADVEAKLSNNSPAYKQRFGDKPVTPATLAETWSPAQAAGNSQASTTNYSAAIAKELGIGLNDTIPNTPEAIEAVKRAITRFEAGTGSGTVNAPAAAPAAATPTAAPVTPTRRPTPGALEKEEQVRQTYKEKLATGSAEDIIAQQKTFSQQTEPKSVAERITSSERVIDVVKKHPNAVGMLTSPGIMNALATIARDGLNTPSGAVGIRTIEDALTVAMPGSSRQVIEARREIAQNLARNALEASKLSQGQGTVSDFERTMFEKIAGSLSDTPEMLIKRQEMLLHRARLDKELGIMYRQSGKKGNPKDYAEFMDRPDVQAKIDKYEEQLRTTLASEIKLSGKKTQSKVPTFEDAEKERRYQEWKSQQSKG